MKKSRKIKEVLTRLEGKEIVKFRKWEIGWTEDFKLSFGKYYYDTEFWQIRIGWFWLVYGRYGLPWNYRGTTVGE